MIDEILLVRTMQDHALAILHYKEKYELREIPVGTPLDLNSVIMRGKRRFRSETLEPIIANYQGMVMSYIALECLGMLAYARGEELKHAGGVQ